MKHLFIAIASMMCCGFTAAQSYGSPAYDSASAEIAQAAMNPTNPMYIAPPPANDEYNFNRQQATQNTPNTFGKEPMFWYRNNKGTLVMTNKVPGEYQHSAQVMVLGFTHKKK